MEVGEARLLALVILLVASNSVYARSTRHRGAHITPRRHDNCALAMGERAARYDRQCEAAHDHRSDALCWLSAPVSVASTRARARVRAQVSAIMRALEHCVVSDMPLRIRMCRVLPIRTPSTMRYATRH